MTATEDGDAPKASSLWVSKVLRALSTARSRYLQSRVPVDELRARCMV